MVRIGSSAKTAPIAGTRFMSDLDWNEIIETSDPERIWKALYSLVQSHGTIQSSTNAGQGLESFDEIYSDIAQEVFLRLITGDRLAYFAGNGFTNEQIESDLLLNDMAAVLTRRKEYLVGQSPDDDQQASGLRRQPVTFKISHASKLI